jgi:hypothetical protein
MENLKSVLDQDTIDSLNEELDQLLSESERSLAQSIVRNTEIEIAHNANVLARLIVKKLFWENVARFSDDKLSKTEDMRQAREKAMNAVKNITRSAANEKEVKQIMDRFVRDIKVEVNKAEAMGKKTDYGNMGW